MKPTRFSRATGVLTKRIDIQQLKRSENSESLGLSRLKPQLDIPNIINNSDLYKRSCLNRNYGKQSQYPYQIAQLYHGRAKIRAEVLRLKKEIKKLEEILQFRATSSGAMVAVPRETTIAQARELKAELKKESAAENDAVYEIQQLALQLPNMTSDFTPIGKEPRLMGYINAHLVPASGPRTESASSAASLSEDQPSSNTPTQFQTKLTQDLFSPKSFPDRSKTRTVSHVEIGERLDLLNFDASSRSSGWGFYYLQRGAALLEQALVQYAIQLCTSAPHAFIPVTPPSIVYSEIASAAGYMPRDANNERQTYTLQPSRQDMKRGRPEHTLAGTAEIPFAALYANASISSTLLPKAVVGPSRCFRAEAGARGTDTKGLYRVHEFTKVEMFGWTLPDMEASLDLFQTMLDIQMKFYESLGLRCRVLEMPSTDLGASAMRKIDIEAYFPSREGTKNGPWGEVSSLSLCGDYQTRRLQTVLAGDSEMDRKQKFPWTVNGTACAVPRVLAAILEAGWDSEREVVKVPEVLWAWMGGMREIGPPPRDKENGVQIGQGGRVNAVPAQAPSRAEEHEGGIVLNGNERIEAKKEAFDMEGFRREGEMDGEVESPEKRTDHGC